MDLKRSVIFIALAVMGCRANSGAATNAEKLGFPANKRILILHADDVGMCTEANEAAAELLDNDLIQSASIMMPCPAADEFVQWAVAHPNKDVGLHLTLTSEWDTYRWGPLAPSNAVPGLIDAEGKLWRSVAEVVTHASAEEVEMEIRAQIDRSIASGHLPGHIDSHMGTLYGHVSYTEMFFKVAKDYGILATVVDLKDPQVIERFKNIGLPVDEAMIKLIEQYDMPKLDNFDYVPEGRSYEDKVEKFKSLVKSLKPGLAEIVFHPSVDSEQLKSITSSWQQRSWETRMFSDPEVIEFLKSEDILFTNWKEIAKRFNQAKHAMPRGPSS